MSEGRGKKESELNVSEVLCRKPLLQRPLLWTSQSLDHQRKHIFFNKYEYKSFYKSF